MDHDIQTLIDNDDVFDIDLIEIEETVDRKTCGWPPVAHANVEFEWDEIPF